MDTVLSLARPGNRVVRDVVTTYAGFFANAVLGFITVRVMAQYLGPDQFGVADLANMFMAAVAGLGEPGIGTALVRLASQPGMTPRAIDELVVAAIRLKLLVVGVLSALAYVLMPWITADFMHRPELTGLLRGCLIGAALLSLAMFAGALFQIRGAFRDNATTIVVAGAVRTVVMLGLWWGGALNLQTAVGSMIVMNVVQCAMCGFALRPMLVSLPWHNWDPQHWRELVGYTKYLVVWLVAGTIHPRADRLLLSHFVHDNRLLGFYAAAAQLSLMVPMLTQSINMVLMPRISALRTTQEMRTALSKCGLGAVAVLLFLTPVALAARPLVRLIFGVDYDAAVPVFQILLFAAGAELALNPLSNFWHALNRPVMLSILNVVRLSLLVLVAVAAIPRMGVAGAALAVIISTLLPLAGQGAVLWSAVKRCGARESL
jgi:O-antigen/teichoic acid export membrane protein